MRTLVGATHLLASALAVAGPMVVAGLRLGAVSAEEDARLRRGLAWSLAAMGLSLAAGGVAAGLVAWAPDTGYAVVWRRVPATALAMLATEWLFTAALYAWCWFGWQGASRWRWRHALIAWVAGTNLLYHFATMMVVLGAVAASPGLADGEPITRPVFRTLITQPLALSLALHYAAYCVLVGGVAGGLAIAGKNGSPAAGRIALAGLGAAMATGVAALVNEPAGVQRAMLGGDAVATAAMLVALAASLRLAWRLTAASAGLGDGQRHFRSAAWLVVAITAVMVWSGHAVSQL